MCSVLRKLIFKNGIASRYAVLLCRAHAPKSRIFWMMAFRGILPGAMKIAPPIVAGDRNKKGMKVPLKKRHPLHFP